MPASSPRTTERRAERGQLFVIYYGWLIAGPDGGPSAAARQIAAARPAALVAASTTAQPRLTNLSAPVRSLFRDAGVRVFAYVATGYGRRDPGLVAAEAGAALADGADGLFLDEAYDFADGARRAYYRDLHRLAKAQGAQVILNTGSAQTGEAIMELADLLMVEHQWRSFYQTCGWRSRYPPERFMGSASNEPGARRELGYAVDGDGAVEGTREAWANGIGWHYSTDRYTELPAWFAEYARRLGYGEPPANAAELPP